ncbi:MAG: TRZ/ATZ family hydrolase [Gammaproteobacteria bacterium]|nr:TRZ/ATZ family hydrolase [Gammaproteobacteria bacterium]
MNIDTLIHAGWIVPVIPENTVYHQHSIALADGCIVDIVPWKQAVEQFHAQATIELRQHCLMPGLINTHTHAPMSLMRGIADDLKLMDWLQNHIWPLEQQWVSEDFVAVGTRLAIAEMLLSGTTCFNDMYFYPETVTQVVAGLGIRATIGLILIDAPTNWAKTTDEYISQGLAVHDIVRNEPLVNTAFAPHAPYTVCDANLLRMRALVEEMEIPIHMHVHETSDEVSNAIAETGKSPVQRLAELELLANGFIGVHMVHVSEPDRALYAESGAHVVHCPSSNLKLASGFCPIQQYVSDGINIALGTDSAASNNRLDMFTEMRSAALIAKAVAHDASAIPAHTALSMATINGARALGIDTVTGSLEAGKSADLIAIDMDDIVTRPMFNPISQLVYATHCHQVTDVWIAGKHLVQSGKLSSMDITQLKYDVDRWQQQLDS